LFSFSRGGKLGNYTVLVERIIKKGRKRERGEEGKRREKERKRRKGRARARGALSQAH
jgi:hypothetical protein